MPRSPEATPCVAHGCSKCCYELEAPLTEADAARLEAHGHDRPDFAVVDDEGVLQLQKKNGRCVFLGEDGFCTVHAYRPEGCRLYPLVWDRDAEGVGLDDWCPFAEEFPDDPDRRRRVRQVLQTLRTEAAARGKAYP